MKTVLTVLSSLTLLLALACPAEAGKGGSFRAGGRSGGASRGFGSSTSRPAVKPVAKPATPAVKTPAAKADGKPGAAATKSLDSRPLAPRPVVTHEQWQTREVRYHTVYSEYHHYPVVVYHDPYPSVFWWWMLSRDADERARWAYHHRAVMAEERLEALKAKDAQLEARLKKLEEEGVVADPAFAPEGMDADLMFDDDHVLVKAPEKAPPSWGWTALRVAGWVLAALALAFLLWLGLRWADREGR